MWKSTNRFIATTGGDIVADVLVAIEQRQPRRAAASEGAVAAPSRLSRHTFPIADRARAERAQARLLSAGRRAAAAGLARDWRPLRSAPRRLRSRRACSRSSTTTSPRRQRPLYLIINHRARGHRRRRGAADRAIAEAIPTDADQLFKAIRIGPPHALSVLCLSLYHHASYRWSRRGRRPGQVKTLGRQKIAEYLGEEEPTLINYICSCLGRRAKPEENRDELATGLGRRRADHGRQAVARVVIPRGEGGAAPLCGKNILLAFSSPFRRSFWQVPRRRRAIAVRAGRRRRRRARLVCSLTATSWHQFMPLEPGDVPSVLE